MRHKYPTKAVVLARSPLGEESALLTVLTQDVGLVRARAQGLKKPGAKLASALQTFCESDVVLVSGKEGWRLSGAQLSQNWFGALSSDARKRAARLSTLLLRLVQGQAPDERLYDAFGHFLTALSTFPEDSHDAIECVSALRILSALGLDAGPIPGDHAAFTQPTIREAQIGRTELVKRVNRGIAASGL